MPTYSINKTVKKKPMPQTTTAQSLAQQVAKQGPLPAPKTSPVTKAPPAGVQPTGGPPPAPNTTANMPPAGAQAIKGQPPDFRDVFKSGDNAGPMADRYAGAKDLAQPTTAAQLQGTYAERENKAAEAAEAEKERNKQLAIEAAKAKAKREAEEIAANRKKEVEQNRDLDGDGKIGGREMGEEDLINAAIRRLLEGGASPEEIQKEREAMQGELKAGEARDIQSVRARTGLGGMGLTGAAGAMESQVRQETGRKQALTMAEFERQQRAEAASRALQGIEARRGEQVFGAAMDMYESEADQDFNGDGLINGKPVGDSVGDGDPNNNPQEGGAPGSGTGEPNVDAQGKVKKPRGGYDPNNPPSNALIPARKAKAYENGYNTDPATVDFYKNIPNSEAGVWPTDDVVDSYIGDDGKLYGVAINSSGQYYTFKLGSESNPNRRNPRT